MNADVWPSRIFEGHKHFLEVSDVISQERLKVAAPNPGTQKFQLPKPKLFGVIESVIDTFQENTQVT